MDYDQAAYWVPRIQWQESRNNPYAVSPAGASGLMQTMPGTLRDPGFGVTPFDPAAPDPIAEKKRVGVDYWNAMFNRYPGNVPTALAAYNWGPGNVDDWIARGSNWNELPAETQDYIRKITGGEAMAADPMGILSMMTSTPSVPDVPLPEEGGIKGLATDPLFNLGIGILKGAAPSRLPVTMGSALAAGGAQLSEAGELAQKNEYNRLRLLQENSQQKMAAALQGIQMASLLGEQKRKVDEANREVANLKFQTGGGLAAAETGVEALERLQRSELGKKMLANPNLTSVLRSDPTNFSSVATKWASEFFSGQPVDDALLAQVLNDIETVEKSRVTLANSLQLAGSRGNTGAFGLQQTLTGQGAGAGIDVQLAKFRESRDLLRNFWSNSGLGDVPSFAGAGSLPTSGPVIADPFAPIPQGGSAPQQAATTPAAGPSFLDRAGAYLSGADTAQPGGTAVAKPPTPLSAGAAPVPAQGAAQAAPVAAPPVSATATEAAQGAAQAAQSVSAKATGAAKEAWGKALPIIGQAQAAGWKAADGSTDYIARALASVDKGMPKGDAKKFLREQGVTRQMLIDRGIPPSLLGF